MTIKLNLELEPAVVNLLLASLAQSQQQIAELTQEIHTQGNAQMQPQPEPEAEVLDKES